VGDNSIGEFYSVALTNHFQQADTGTKMIHIGKGTKSTIVSKGISAGESHNTYRGIVQMNKSAKKASNFTQCDSMLIGNACSANTFPTIDVRVGSGTVGHEATTVKVTDDQLFYFNQRGIGTDAALASIVNGFCKDVFSELPDEFGSEAQALLELKLENSVG